MAIQRRLDRKAKAAIAVVILIFLATVALGLRSCVVAVTPEQAVAAPDSGQDQVVLLGRETMVLPSGSVGSKIVSWLNVGGAGTRAFEVGDQSFPSGSDQPTQVGLAHLDRFAEMMRADSDVKARVIVTASDGDQSDNLLAERRATRIQTELVARGVPISRISTEARPVAANVVTSKGKEPPIVVVISK